MKACFICRKLYRPGPYVEHMKAHVRRGEAVRHAVVTAEAGNVTRYQWQRAAVYTRKAK